MISTKGRYAVRMMIDLAENGREGFVALKDIAERQQISKKYLEQIIPLLCRAGMLIAAKGARGGYRLAKEPDMITVGDILRAAEGSLAPVSCPEFQRAVCPRAANCPTLGIWSGLERVINRYVDNITLSDALEGRIPMDD